MPAFEYTDNQMYAEGIPLQKLANEFGTPTYVYSAQTIKYNWQQYADALKFSAYPHKMFYAVKANSNIAILNMLLQMGAGFDAVSGGEIDRVIAAGGTASQIIFSGVGKSVAEITKAITLGIHSINIESTAELTRVHDIAKQLNKTANIAFRVNPDINIASHPYISTGGKDNKFGIDHNEILAIYKLAATLSHIKIHGITCHIGSQITSLEPFEKAVDEILSIVDQLADADIHLEFIDMGGGLGIRYNTETPPAPADYINAIVNKLRGRNIVLHLEPGRSIVADAGILLTKVEYLKTTADTNFAIVDAAMNDLIRPALYESFHDVVTTQLPSADTKTKTYVIVGPVCESGDFLAKDRRLALKTDDLLAIKDCGAYGFSMSSNYNTRPRCAEILVDGTQAHVIRERDTAEQLIQNERIIDVSRSLCF